MESGVPRSLGAQPGCFVTQLSDPLFGPFLHCCMKSVSLGFSSVTGVTQERERVPGLRRPPGKTYCKLGSKDTDSSYKTVKSHNVFFVPQSAQGLFSRWLISLSPTSEIRERTPLEQWRSQFACFLTTQEGRCKRSLRGSPCGLM